MSADVAVIGAGPAGVVTALELARCGVSVALIETGGTKHELPAQELSKAADLGADNHAPVELTIRRQVGGTSTIWGGRCVPYDPIDFQERPWLAHSRWPIGHAEIQPYFGRACEWTKCGRPVFSAHEVPGLPPGLVPGLTDLDGVTATDLERWSLPTDFGAVYGKELRRSAAVTVYSGLTAVELQCAADGTVRQARCRTLGRAEVFVAAGQFVVAAGGLESTRLLMHSTAPGGGTLGDHSGHLGRWYMAHLEGVIAEVDFATDPAATINGYERDIDGTYVRRRFAFTTDFLQQHDLPNICGWITNPELADASHGQPDLSFVYLMLTSKLGPMFAPDAQRLSLTGVQIPGTPYGHAEISPRRDHVRNVLTQPGRTISFASGFGFKRVLKPGRRAPGFFAYSADNRYPFQYHGEHLPRQDSRVRLTEEYDRIGMRKLAIDLRFSEEDFDGVVRAHEYWDAHLRRTRVGRLRYVSDQPRDVVRARAGGGFHQVGTTRMAADPSDGVVDANLRIHGVDNAYVVSSSTFVTSGQANSTLMIVAFAVRLAGHLRSVIRGG